MIPKQCRRLAEVDFPISTVSSHALREKAIRHGHPSALHLWWARRPLASSRAMLLGLLLPDPCDPDCPQGFKDDAKEILAEVRQRPSGDDELRKALLWFVGAFASWDMAANRTYLKVARDLLKAAHPAEPPLVVDPLAGGGSIPLEALRLGCESFASDLNPVACLILKVMLEQVPLRGATLTESLRRNGADIKRKVEREVAELYPEDPDGAKPIAYIWARTIRCESPHCGAEVPVFKSAWLSKKGSKKARYFREAEGGRCVALVVDQHPLGGPVTFRIARGHGSKDPQSGYAQLATTKAKGNNASVICPCCGAVVPGNRANPRTIAQLAAQRGGAETVCDTNGHRTGGARMLAVVTLKPGAAGRHYRLPCNLDYVAVRKAQDRLQMALRDWEYSGRGGLSPVPDEPTPVGGGSGAGRAFSVQRYGMREWGDLFTARQKLTLMIFAAAIAGSDVEAHSRDLLAIAMDKTADLGNALVPWKPDAECPVHLFARQAIGMAWDFAESVPIRESSGSFESAYERSADALESVASMQTVGQVQLADAAAHPLPDETAHVWFTDPPYYDAVPYADLSDFFYVWLKRALPNQPLLQDPFDRHNPLTPKTREAVQDERALDTTGRPKDQSFYEETMARSFAEGRRILRPDGVASVVFAHKTTEGWEALLSGMIRGGLTITGSWPIATESSSRLRARESAALATSVHLICRPRPSNAQVGDWANVLREVPGRVSEWMERLQSERIRGADLVFACIGPALEIFSRYTSVESADGRQVTLAEYLEKVWEVVGRSALAQVLGTAAAADGQGTAGAVEEDARLTALFLWTLQSTEGEREEGAADADGDEEAAEEGEDEDDTTTGTSKGLTLVFDVVRRFAQPLGIELPRWEGRIIETRKGTVRLLPIAERAEQLFGEDGAEAVAARLEDEAAIGSRVSQLKLFPATRREQKSRVPARGRGGKRGPSDDGRDEGLAAGREATTLDRVHAAMLLQAAGRTNALRALLKAEQERGTEFLRLGNALSALYPKTSEEKRLLDAMLLAVPR